MYALHAIYAGDLNYASSNSSVLEQTVNAYQTSVFMVSNLNPSLYGQAVTWSAMVRPRGLLLQLGMLFFGGRETV